jgi:hypothetical protein
VIIGYIFDNADTQGKYAKVVIDGNDKKHSGQSVRNECFGIYENGRCNTVRRQIAGEFRRVVAALRRGLTINNILCQMQRKNCRTYSIIKGVADEQGNDTNSLIELLVASQRDFEADCVSRRDRIDKIVIFNTRALPYKELYAILQKTIEDPDDIEVILDAHHVGQTIRNLILVSGNYWDITAFRQIICRNTSITDVRSLTSFAPT